MDQINHFLFLHDVPDENIGLNSMGRLLPRAGGLGGRLPSPAVGVGGGLGTLADPGLILRTANGLLIKLDE